MKKIICTYEYNPQYGCGYNQTVIYEENNDIIFSTKGWRTNRAFLMPKQDVEKAKKIMIEESYKISSIYKNTHFFSCGSISTLKMTIEEARLKYKNNILKELEEILYYHLIERKIFCRNKELTELISGKAKKINLN